MNESAEDGPKIVVDDDWKAQVEKEKQAAAKGETPADAEPTQPLTADSPAAETPAAETPTPESTQGPGAASSNPESPTDPADSVAATASQGDQSAVGAPPPASLEALVTMLFSQAMVALGQLPGPDGQPAKVEKPLAKYFIDSVEMLGEKTKGNLTDEETRLISEALHAMRMAYVSVKAK